MAEAFGKHQACLADTLPSSAAHGIDSGLRDALRRHTQLAYREAILASAEHLMNCDGQYKPLRIVEVADAAGISIGTLYNYFESKDALVVALYERQRSFLRGRLEQPYERGCAEQRLRELIEGFFRLAKNERERLRLMMRLAETAPQLSLPATAFSKGPSNSASRISRLVGLDEMLSELVQRGVVEGTFRANLRTDLLVCALSAMIESEFVEERLNPDSQSIEDRAETILVLVFDGARA